jgi:FKBP-type peptidyl-prolyl cis-trans isomerase FkpA
MSYHPFAVTIFALVTLSPAFAADEAATSKDEKVYYYLGTRLGQSLLPLDLNEQQAEMVARGMQDTVNGNAEKLDDAVYGPRLNEIAAARPRSRSAAEREEAQRYLQAMAAEEGAVTTASGLVFRELEAGTGASPSADSMVKTHYHGTLRDGSVFDSSVNRGQPLEISLDSVIPCWSEGLAMMKEGGKAKLTCPSDLAYGDRGSGAIPGGAALTFQVELIEVVN